MDNALKAFLDEQVERFMQPAFITDDPISIPRQFKKKQDIEIIAFWTAMISWGQRTTIIQNAQKLVALMDGAPYDFIVNHKESDRKWFLDWKHRTFQPIDTLYFLSFLQHHYQNNNSLESAFLEKSQSKIRSVEDGLKHFHHTFFSLSEAPQRTRKHVATPHRKSTCKRLNMFLRWMVRPSDNGIDFGLWKAFDSSQLMIPLDVHVERISRKLGLLKRKQLNWLAVEEITAALRKFDPKDPVKYDFALFGLGVLEKRDGKIPKSTKP